MLLQVQLESNFQFIFDSNSSACNRNRLDAERSLSKHVLSCDLDGSTGRRNLNRNRGTLGLIANRKLSVDDEAAGPACTHAHRCRAKTNGRELPNAQNVDFHLLLNLRAIVRADLRINDNNFVRGECELDRRSRQVGAVHIDASLNFLGFNRMVVREGAKQAARAGEYEKLPFSRINTMTSGRDLLHAQNET